MKVTFLGSGSCYGVPTVGNDWGDCDPHNPKNRRTVTSITVEKDGTKILVDLSPDFLEHSIKHDLTNLSAILYTHGHTDHILGNFYLPRLLQYYKGKNLPLYADIPTQQDIQRMFWFQIDENGRSTFTYGGQTHWETITPFQSFAVGEMTILPLPQEHEDITSFTFRIGNFAYSTDFNNLPDETLEQLQGLDCWIVECNRRHATENSVKHLYLDRALDFIARVNPKQAYLTHTGVTLDYDTITVLLPPNVHMGYDGLEIEL